VIGNICHACFQLGRRAGPCCQQGIRVLLGCCSVIGSLVAPLLGRCYTVPLAGVVIEEFRNVSVREHETELTKIGARIIVKAKVIVYSSSKT
jgi:hypothetical protein